MNIIMNFFGIVMCLAIFERENNDYGSGGIWWRRQWGKKEFIHIEEATLHNIFLVCPKKRKEKKEARLHEYMVNLG